MTNPTPLGIEAPAINMIELLPVPISHQDATRPETQAEVVEPQPAQSRVLEAIMTSVQNQVPAVADSALPSPPIETQLYAHTAHEFLQTLHLRGQLVPLLKQVSRERRILSDALSAGVMITGEELQSVADNFRTQHGLSSAADMMAWLRREHLTAHQFEAAIERGLVMEKINALQTNSTTDNVQRQETPDAYQVGQENREDIDWDLQILIQ